FRLSWVTPAPWSFGRGGARLGRVVGGLCPFALTRPSRRNGARRLSPWPAYSCGTSRARAPSSRTRPDAPTHEHTPHRRSPLPHRGRRGIPTCDRESVAIRASSDRFRAAQTR